MFGAPSIDESDCPSSCVAPALVAAGQHGADFTVRPFFWAINHRPARVTRAPEPLTVSIHENDHPILHALSVLVQRPKKIR
jgi:hypothetical protein